MKKNQIFNKKLVLICLIIVFSIIYFVVYTDSKMNYSSEEIVTTSHTPEIIKNQVYNQTINFESKNIRSFKLLFGTFNRVNNSYLRIELSQSGKEIQTWEIPCNRLKDNSYYTFQIDKQLNNLDKYNLQITTDAEKGNGICIYTKEAKTKSLYITNGEQSDGEIYILANYRKNIRQIFIGANLYHTCILFVLVGMCLLTILFFSKDNIKIQNQFIILWIIFGLMYGCSSTVFNAPDEENHFYRAYEISCYNLISSKKETTEQVGRKLPLNVDLNKLECNWNTFALNSGMKLSNESVFMEFPNTALYSPISYFPQSVGIFLGRHLTNNVAVIAYMGRIMNWLMIGLLLYFTIALLPRGKMIAFIIFMIPMNIFESFSLAPDGMVVAIISFMVSYTMRLCEDKDKPYMKHHEIFLLYVLAIVVSLYKIVYLPMCLLYFLIPSSKFRGIKNKITHAISMGILSVGSSLIWLKSCEQFLVIKGTNASDQLSFVLHHPINWCIVLFRTWFELSTTWINWMIGSSLNELSVPVSGIVIIIYLVLLLKRYKIIQYTKDRERARILRLVFSIMIISICLLISLSLYLQWTPVYDTKISGIQGRYFIGLLLPLYFVFSPIEKNDEDIITNTYGSYCTISAVNICACINLLLASL